jgi:AraC-like DNA-binding protein
MQTTTDIVNHRLEELAMHGAPDFPLAVYSDDFSLFETGKIDWHWHQALQFSYVLEGELLFDIGRIQYILKPGEAIFINRGVLHQIKPAAAGPAHMFAIDFDPLLIVPNTHARLYQQYIEPIISASGLAAIVIMPDSAGSLPDIKSPLPILRSSQLLDTLLTIHALSETHDELALISALIYSWHTLYRLLPPHLLQSEGTDYPMAKVKNALSYMHMHYADDITLADIAAAANISKGDCCRTFQQTLHMTPFEYLLSHRIRIACDMLLTTDMPIAAIATSVGFNHVSYFGKVFKRLTLTTPLQYRHKHHKTPRSI